MEAIFEVVHFNFVDFLFQVINIYIVIFVLNKFFFKPINEVINKREEVMKKKLFEIDCAWNKIKKKEEEYKNIIEKAKKEYSLIIDKANLEGEEIKTNIYKEAEKKAIKILSNAKENIKNEKNIALNLIKKNIVDLITLSMKKILKNKLDNNMQKKILDDFIKDSGEYKNND